jgi:acyl carrier protein
LVAYVRTADRTDVTAGALRQFLHERIPHFMVPGQFELLTTFPLTVNGKVDRSALPRLAAHTVPESRSQTGELSAVEQELAEIWAGLLDVRPIGRDDDFFMIGGHSLLATRLVTVLADRFAVEVPLRLLFEHPTLAALAEQIDHLRLSGAERDDLASLVAQVESLCLDGDGEAHHD